MNIGGTSAGRFTMAQDSSAPEGFANSLKLTCTTDDTSIANDELLFYSKELKVKIYRCLPKEQQVQNHMLYLFM